MELEQERGEKRPVPGGDDDQDLLMEDSAATQQQQQQQQESGVSAPAAVAAAAGGQGGPRPWEIDIQNNSHRTCCGECHGVIKAGQLKVRRTGTRFTRVYHPLCAVGLDGGLHDITGVDDLPDPHKAALVEQLAWATRARAQGGGGQEEAGCAEARMAKALVEPDGPREELLHMDFWDRVDWKEFLIPVNTIAEPPAAMLVELARAKLTVVRAANDATSQGKEEESTRAWKLLLAMDAMILQKPGMKRGGRNTKGQHTVARAISSRLRQFWEGDWDAMLRGVTEAAAAGRPRRRTPTIEDEARRIRGLMDIGELRRATAQVTDPAQTAEGGGTSPQHWSQAQQSTRRGTQSHKDSGETW